MSISRITTCIRRLTRYGAVMTAIGGGKGYGGHFLETEPETTLYGCVCLVFLIVCILTAVFVIDLLSRLWPMVAA